MANYKGADAGRLLMSGTLSISTSMALDYRRIDAPGIGTISANPWTTGGGLLGLAIQPDIPSDKIPPPLGLPPAFAGAGFELATHLPYRGDVATQTLPAGTYEITEIRVYLNNMVWTLGDIAIPFEIKSGVTTYIGDFRAVSVKGKVMGLKLAAYRFLDISDQSQRDVPAIQSRHPEYGTIEVAIPVVSASDRERLSTPP